MSSSVVQLSRARAFTAVSLSSFALTLCATPSPRCCQADIARAALAFAGFHNFHVPQNVEAANKAYEAVVPEKLRYTEEQWLNNPYQARV